MNEREKERKAVRGRERWTLRKYRRNRERNYNRRTYVIAYNNILQKIL